LKKRRKEGGKEKGPTLEVHFPTGGAHLKWGGRGDLVKTLALRKTIGETVRKKRPGETSAEDGGRSANGGGEIERGTQNGGQAEEREGYRGERLLSVVDGQNNLVKRQSKKRGDQLVSGRTHPCSGSGQATVGATR